MVNVLRFKGGSDLSSLVDKAETGAPYNEEDDRQSA
jgi:hypothetical protein